MDVTNDSGLNEKKLNQMKLEILRVEKENLKTREKPTEEMVELIAKIIIRESKKTY